MYLLNLLPRLEEWTLLRLRHTPPRSAGSLHATAGNGEAVTVLLKVDDISKGYSGYCPGEGGGRKEAGIGKLLH